MKDLLKNKKILYLYTGDHLLHRRFAESIGADINKISWKIPKNYDIYFVEGDYVKIVMMKKLGKINRNSKIIVLMSDPRLFYLNSLHRFDTKKKEVIRTSTTKKIIAKKFLNQLDGVICVGKFEKSLFRKLNKTVPIKIVSPFIRRELYDELLSINPNLNNKNILFIGSGPDYHYKGIDILIEVFKELRKKYPEVQLKIVGKWKVDPSWNIDGISFEGEQKNIFKYMQEISLYLHLARGEAYGLTIIESMIAGLPCIVSNITGAKEAVKEVAPDFIVPLKKEKIIPTIEKYFESSLSEKKILSRKFRKNAEKFNEKDVLKFFKKQFEKLIEEIYNEK